LIFWLQWLVNYFSRLTTEQSMACMQEMLRVNIRQNLQIVIQIATKYSDVLGPVKLIEMFESFKMFEGERYVLRTNNLRTYNSEQAFTITSGLLSTLARIRRFISSISRLPLALDKFGKSSAFAGRVTSTTLRKSRISSRRQNSQTSFPSLLSAIGSILSMILFSTFTRTASPNLSRYMFSKLTR